jgi:excinuclease ABC subunit C
MAVPPAVINRLPEEPGVYRFRDGNGRTLYIGRAVRLRRRVRSYWGDLRGRRQLTRMVPRIARIEAAVCVSGHEASWLERNLLEESCPRWNRVIGGAEVPLMIVVDQRPPRLRILHETGIPPEDELIFGPFLGGVKVRLLASAISRVHPMAYARDQLTGAERDLGRILGVAAADRDRMLGSVIALLSRDPVAVTEFLAELRERRDSASQLHSYETAGRIQNELEAAAWLLAPQRLAVGPTPLSATHRADRHDSTGHELYGWCEGVLVQFRWQDGRMRGWRIRECTADQGRRRLAETPQEWRAFTEVNARLAASLRS